ncbi:hypothetical protein R83H12_01769 [Fibrobacteria bacterium R8-3-H12]
MKKILTLSLFAMAAMVSQAWGVVCTSPGGGSFCQFDTGCYEMSSEYSDGKGCTKPNCTCAQVIENCTLYGSVYKGVTGLNEGNEYGRGLKCTNQGGTWTNEGANPNRTALGCCQWETETKCYTIWSGTDPNDSKDGTEKVTDCNGGLNTFWSGECPSGGACPSGTPAYNGKNPADGFCCWEANEYNNYQGYCGPIGGETTKAKCETDGGSIVTGCGSCRTTGQPGTNPTPPDGGDPTPILNPAQSMALIVAPFGRSLHISSAKEATVSLYDMSGAKVYSGKVRAGNSVFSLEKVSSGSYYAIVQSGSNSKKVSVILK